MSEPASVPPPPRYAGLGRRFVALAIDLACAWVALSIAVNAIVPGALDESPSAHQTKILGLVTLAVLTLWFNYLVLTEWRWGQTLGKRALGIEVAADAEGRPTWNRVVVRNLALVADFLAGPLLIALSARRQRLGDRMGRTVVLVKRGRASENAPAEAAPATAERGGDVAADAGGSVAPPAAPPPEPTTAPGATWGPGRVAAGIGALLVMTLVEVAIVSVFDPDLSSLGARLVTQALLAATLIGVALAASGPRRAAGAPFSALGLRRPLRSPFGLAAAAYLSYIVTALVYSGLVHPHQKDITRDLGFGHGTVGAIAAGALIIVAAPISEEVFFRGFIYGGLRNRLSFGAAAFLSAAIFGVFHYTGPGSLGVLPQLAVLGFALAWVYEETGSIYPTMAIHALNNTLAFLILTS